MLKTIVHKELLGHVLSLRLAVGAIFSLILFTAAALVLSADHHDRVKTHRAAVAEHRQELAKTLVYSGLNIAAERPPAALSVLCQGVERSLPGSSRYSLLSPPALGGHGTRRNPLLVVLPTLDLAIVVQVVLSLLALVFVYDAFSGERARGTLALTLANSLPRPTLLLGKYLGAMAVLAPLLVAGLGLSLAVLLSSSYVALSGREWLAVLLVALLGLAYLSVMVLVGLLISSSTRRPGTSLVGALFVWVVLVLLMPQVATQTAAAVSPLPSARELAVNEAEVERAAERQIYDYAEAHPVPLAWDDLRFNVDRGSMYSGSVPMLDSLYSAPREYVEWALAGARFGLPILSEAAAEVQQLRAEMVLEMAAQADLARWLRLLSPAGAFYDAVVALTGTGHDNYLRFLSAANTHRQSVLEHARAAGGLDYRFFSRPEIKQMPSLAELEALEQRGDKLRLEQLLGNGFKDQEPLDLGTLPPFRLPPLAAATWLKTAIAGLTALLLANLLLALVTAVRFSTADVRS